MATLLEPMAGRVEIDGIDVTIDPRGGAQDHRLHAGPRRRLRAHHRARVPGVLRRRLPGAVAGHIRRGRRRPGAHRPQQAPGQARGHHVQGHEAAPAARAHPAARPQGPHPRRARQRPRSARAHRDPRSAPGAARRWARPSSSPRTSSPSSPTCAPRVGILERGRLVVAGPIARHRAAPRAAQAQPALRRRPARRPRRRPGAAAAGAGLDGAREPPPPAAVAAPTRNVRIKALAPREAVLRGARLAARDAERRRPGRRAHGHGRRTSATSRWSPAIVRALVAARCGSSASSRSATSSSGSSSRSRRERCNERPSRPVDAPRPGRRQRAAPGPLRAPPQAIPNPIWMRELRQSARLARTPWVLFALTLTLGLLMCSHRRPRRRRAHEPATIGGALFQVFFSLAYFVVVLVGPAVAANGIASEREGRTWEAVLLTGLRAAGRSRAASSSPRTRPSRCTSSCSRRWARCRSSSAASRRPRSSSPSSFLFLIAGLAVAFGLAVSSLMSSLRGAIVVTLMLAILRRADPLLLFGFGASFAHPQAVERGARGASPSGCRSPTRARPSGSSTCCCSSRVPLAAPRRRPAWFLYEATIANLSGEADDRSTGPQALVPLLHAAHRHRLRRPQPRSRTTTSRASASRSLGSERVRALPRVLRVPLRGRAAGAVAPRAHPLGARAARRSCAASSGRASPRRRCSWRCSASRACGSSRSATWRLVQLLGIALEASTRYIEQIFFFALYASGFFVFVVGLTAGCARAARRRGSRGSSRARCSS